MIRISRSIGILAALLLALAACSPVAGPLGTPATPQATVSPSGAPGATPSDELPISTPVESIAPTLTPSSAPATPGPSESPSGTEAPVTETEAPVTAPPATQAPAPTPAATPTPAPTGTTIVRAYFVLGSFTGNEGLVPVLRTFPETKAVARAAMEALLQGPNAAEMSVSPAMYTAIPGGTDLLGIAIEDGVATVNLSGDFASGGGTYAVTARLAQVVYTLTQFASVDNVLFQLDGKTVTTFSSEGLVLDGPVGRADFRDMLPAIFVDRPAWGAAIGNPAPISGIANVFEATFRAQILDAKGQILADEQVMASCGTGCWGKFATKVPYSVTKAQYGTLRVFDLSAKDGTPENVTEYKVWLTPAG